MSLENKEKVIVSVNGGCVTGVYSSSKNVEVKIYDFDDAEDMDIDDRSALVEEFDQNIAGMTEIL